MIEGAKDKLKEDFQQSFFRLLYQNISAPIARLQNIEAFSLPFKVNDKDQRALVRQAGGNLGCVPLPSNYSRLFNKEAKLRDPEITLKLAEFLDIVLKNEQEMGFNPLRGRYAISTTQEQPNTPFFERRRSSPSEFKTDFHMDFFTNPKARVYLVSDDISPTLIKDKNGNINVCEPYTVYCMSGHTIHSPGPMLNPKRDFTGVRRNFARCIVT